MGKKGGSKKGKPIIPFEVFPFSAMEG
jgi:hypothetical protein